MTRHGVLLAAVIDGYEAAPPLERLTEGRPPFDPLGFGMMFEKPTLISFAQNGTRPQRITSKVSSLTLAS
jgi:hypothetical protein